MSELNFFSAVGWVATYTGAAFNVLEPQARNIHLSDIAASLSKQCRYGGHCVKFYSVAEHCVHVAEQAPARLKLAALLHDGSEAYLIDIPRPVKKALLEYRAIEDRLMAAIAKRYDFEWPLHPTVVELDNRILLDEVAQNMTQPTVGAELVPWGIPGEPLGVTLQFWTPAEARYRFTTAFHRYAAIDAAA